MWIWLAEAEMQLGLKQAFIYLFFALIFLKEMRKLIISQVGYV